jgi:DNA-binding CsgD family transcriptional regulator
MSRLDPTAVVRDVAGLADRELAPYDLRVEAMERLARAVPVDSWCFLAVDPGSLLTTSHTTSGVDRGTYGRSTTAAVYAQEYREERDVGKHRQLARAKWPICVMSQATRGELERSQRFREVVVPMGLRHELRAAVREGTTTWGFIHLLRGPERPDFDAAEAALVERVSRAIAPLIRRCQLGEGVVQATAPVAPSLVLLDGANVPTDATATMTAWARALRDPEVPDQQTPEPFLAVAERARALAAAGLEGSASVRVRGADDAWYTAHAQSTVRDRVAVIVQPSQPYELVPLLLSHYALTPAEQQVTELVLRGRSTREIAGDLVLSPHTVQDRLKSVFAKAGVRSRRELVAQLNGGAI